VGADAGAGCGVARGRWTVKTQAELLEQARLELVDAARRYERLLSESIDEELLWTTEEA
jgi:hypothetical protein